MSGSIINPGNKRKMNRGYDCPKDKVYDGYENNPEREDPFEYFDGKGCIKFFVMIFVFLITILLIIFN